MNYFAWINFMFLIAFGAVEGQGDGTTMSPDATTISDEDSDLKPHVIPEEDDYDLKPQPQPNPAPGSPGIPAPGAPLVPEIKPESVSIPSQGSSEGMTSSTMQPKASRRGSGCESLVVGLPLMFASLFICLNLTRN